MIAVLNTTSFARFGELMNFSVTARTISCILLIAARKGSFCSSVSSPAGPAAPAAVSAEPVSRTPPEAPASSVLTPAAVSASYQIVQFTCLSISSVISGKAFSKSSGWQSKKTRGFSVTSLISFGSGSASGRSLYSFFPLRLFSSMILLVMYFRSMIAFLSGHDPRGNRHLLP